jgi:hypothetical protein
VEGRRLAAGWAELAQAKTRKRGGKGKEKDFLFVKPDLNHFSQKVQNQN